MRISDWSSDVCSSDLIIVDRLHQLVQLMLEKMVRATDLVMMDGDALLRPQLVDQLLHGAGGYDLVRRPLHVAARRAAGPQAGEVIHVRLRRNRDEAPDFRTAH